MMAFPTIQEKLLEAMEAILKNNGLTAYESKFTGGNGQGAIFFVTDDAKPFHCYFSVAILFTAQEAHFEFWPPTHRPQFPSGGKHPPSWEVHRFEYQNSEAIRAALAKVEACAKARGRA